MCQFFSLISDRKGKAYYFKDKERKLFLKGKLGDVQSPDSHTSIATYFGFKGKKEDSMNKYEYNPITKIFTVDQINTKDDSQTINKLCADIDFKEIIPELIIKPIIHPFNDFGVKEITKSDIALVKKWASVGASVGDSVGDSVWASVRDSVRDSVGDSVGASVWASVRDSVGASVGASVGDSVGDSVRDSVWDSVGDSVRDSVWDSVWAYTSSMFNIDTWKYCEKIKYVKGTNPFQPCIDLWNKGLVPSFDGTNWRLHGKDGKELWKGKFKKL